MNDTQARARVWTLCLYALVLCVLTGPLVGAYVALAVLLVLAVRRVVRLHSPGRR